MEVPTSSNVNFTPKPPSDTLNPGAIPAYSVYQRMMHIIVDIVHLDEMSLRMHSTKSVSIIKYNIHKPHTFLHKLLKDIIFMRGPVFKTFPH